ncbi:hypothetical protein F0U47_12200 [Nocardioides antri]|uniref:Uncharacterized protein n=1 Tax=Nocardioides antri TaxID=2607659 RepID=A0A5B1M3Y2_9ACTN|nr:hypothetical protein F0U47_12200 [Nocardioides antri]
MEDPAARPLDDGSTKVTLTQNRSRIITIRTAESSTPGDADGEIVSHVGIECVTQDSATEADASRTNWTTIVRVVTDLSSVHVWVENRVETDDLSLRVQVGRPRLVDDLLSIPGRPHLAGSGLFTEVQPILADEVAALTELLQSPTRALPVIVCSEPGGDHDDRWTIWAERIARRAGGIATVITLDSGAVTAFRRALGDLAVWGGGVRVYTPTPVVDPTDGWRHRYTPGHLMASREDAMVDRIVYVVAQMSTRRRVPDEFLGFTTTAPAEAAPGASAGFVSEDEQERERIHWETLLEQQVAETNASERELAQKIGHLDRIRLALEEQGLHELFWGTQHETGAEIPDEVQDTSTAVFAAQMYLTDRLLVHDDAPRELDGIDTCPQAYSWGNKTWRGFRALAAYAEERSNGFRGSFWDWCTEGRPFAWPANTKHLSMTESETVQNSAKLSRTRVLPVSTEVDPSAKILMLSHLKISEGGGDLAPRVYFYDDTGGNSGKVHVGFVGPHHLMPNTKS